MSQAAMPHATPSPSPAASRHPIAIIGAGLAGISCAQLLTQAGHSVHLFDKSRGPSGRMSTRRSQDAATNWQCDHGAPFFSPTDSHFRAEVETWVEAGVAAAWPARLATHGAQGLKPHTDAITRFVGTPRMTTPAAHLIAGMEQLPQPLHCQWQTTLTALQNTAAGWQLHSLGHGPLPQPYRAVLLALPAPQANALLVNLAPEATALAQRAPMQPCWALMVRCKQPLRLPFDGCFVEQGPLQWLARDSSKPQRTGPETWLLHASPRWSQTHLEADPATATQTLLQAFAELGGPKPSSVQATAHRWRYAQAAQPLQIGGWWQPSTALGLCGDWLHNGGVEGAWLSGRSLAQQVLSSLG